MKLSAKITLSVVLIVALAVGSSGYAIISSVFHAQLVHQVTAAAEETQLLCSVLGTMAVERRTSATARVTQETMESTLNGSPFRSFRLRLTGGSSDGPVMNYRIVRVVEGGAPVYDLAVTCRFTVDQQEYWLESLHDVSSIYALREQYVKIYQMVYLIAVLVSVLTGFALSAVLTAPIRKLSRSARQIAEGNYSFRANVRTGDEIGILAAQFNHMAKELEGHIASLELASQQQKDFTASFAHELKTPLTSIIGYADTLRSRRLPEEQQFEAAHFIFSEGRRLETMSHSLLRLFSLDSEQPQMRPFSAAALVQAVEESVEYPLHQRQLVLEVQVEDRQLMGEQSLLTVLLYNLVDNARKASQPGSKITILGIPGKDGYCFAVKDRGRGIPPEALPRITEPFYMVDKSRSRAEGGAGLGLALCRRIAQLHGTELHYDSKVDRGTVVSFRIQEVQK